MSGPQNDLIIVGGGCAGLSLASRLAGSSVRVTVLEAREKYRGDRTWCFWSAHARGYEHLATHAWPAWSFDNGGLSVAQRDDAISYLCVPSERFYEASKRAISHSTNIKLRCGVTVDRIMDDGDVVHVDCGGQRISAHHVIDTRPPSTATTPDMMQVFVGKEVCVDRDCFDPSTAGLMTDMSVDARGFRFTYLLPFTTRHALVEETRFATQSVPAKVLERGLERSLARLAPGAQVDVLREERGLIPMQPMPLGQHSGRIVRAGTAGGAVRASTGYAFARIQRWADACALAVKEHGRPVSHSPDPGWLRWADALFLRVLRVQPELAPVVFMAMGQLLSAQTLVRFLSDDATPADFVQVASVLPKRPFLREFAATLGDRLSA